MNQKNFLAVVRLIRLDRPIGIFLLLWPTLGALILSNKGLPSLKLMIIFTFGVILMRSAGCVVNDLLDQKYDRFVKRTVDRPLVTNQISASSAKKILFFLVLASFILVLFTNKNTILLSIVALFLALVYPLCKRFTSLPQYVLGAAFAMAIPMTYTASEVSFDISGWMLFIATIIWAVAYDTLYAMVDRKDDLKLGVQSTAILFGTHDKLLIFFHHTGVLVLYCLIGILNHFSIVFWGLMIVALVSVGYQQMLIRHRQEVNCFEAFLNNNWFGFILFLGIGLSYS